MVAPIIRRNVAPLLGAVARDGIAAKTRWEKDAQSYIRSAQFESMAVEKDKVRVERGYISALQPPVEAYDNLMGDVLEHMMDAPLSSTANDTATATPGDKQTPANALAGDRGPRFGSALHVDDVLLPGEQAKPPDSSAAAPAAPAVPHIQHNFTKPLERVHLCYEKAHAKLMASIRQPSLVDQLANPLESSTSRVTGRERLNMIRMVLDSFGLERSDMQKIFHEDMIGACAKLIFKDDLLAELDDLLLELGVSELKQQFMAITPRRMGKTMSVAMFVVALLFSLEGVEQAIFSTGRRASQKLIELVYRLLCKIPGMKESIVKHNVETIWIQGPGGVDDVRKVFSYPSNVRISYSLFFSLCCVFVFFAREKMDEWMDGWTETVLQLQVSNSQVILQFDQLLLNVLVANIFIFLQSV